MEECDIPETQGIGPADITMISKDNKKVKVHSYILKTASPVFRAMLSDSDSAFHPGPIPIDIDITSLETFLDMMYLPNPRKVKDGHQAMSLLKLCDQFECLVAMERVRFRVEPLVKSNPWEFFCWASHRNDVRLAKTALEVMYREDPKNTIHFKHLKTELAEQCATSYLLGLMRSLQAYAEHKSMDSFYWMSLAQSFQPAP